MSPTDPEPRIPTHHRPPIAWLRYICFRYIDDGASSKMLFEDVIRGRRSQRFLKPAPLREICRVIHMSTQWQFVNNSDGQLRTRRPSVASGGLHEIEVLFIPRAKNKRLLHYDSESNEIYRVGIRPENLENVWEAARRVLPSGVSTLIVLMARPQVLRNCYLKENSLLWRDAGALLQTISMTAHNFGLGFCPIGILGKELETVFGAENEELIAVGCGWLGCLK